MPCDRSGVWARLRVPLYGAFILSLALVTGIGSAAAQSRDVSFGAQRAPVTFGGWRSNAAERQAARYLEDARMVLEDGNALEGRRRLEILVARFPDTKAADEARVHLSRLYNEPARNTARGTSVRPGGERTETSTSVAADVRPGPQASIAETRFAAAAEWDLRITSGDRVFFGDGSADLGSSARSVLGAQARWLKQNPEILVILEGHAHEPGTEGSNADLALRRAQAVRARLIELGVDGSRIAVETRGRLHPVALCAGPDCAAQNRRVVTRVAAAPRSQAVPVRQTRAGVPGNN
jgi:peptidoglycan-associated lipoprotein